MDNPKNTDTPNGQTGFQQFSEGKDETEILQTSIAGPGTSYAQAEQVLLENTIDSQTRADWTQQDWEENQQQVSHLFNDLADAMKADHAPGSDIVQRLVQQHYDLSRTFYTMSASVYTAMAELFREHPGFRFQLESIDANLPEFLAASMLVFADNP